MIKNIQGSVDLMRLEKSVVVSVKGRRCLLVPIDENDMYVSKDDTTGAAKSCYLHLSIFEYRDGANKFGNTHYCKPGMSKEFMEANPEIAKRKKDTFMGNFKPLFFESGNQAETVAAPEVTPDNMDDLPF